MQPPSPLGLLKDTPYNEYTSSSVKLTGGFINHVWRLTNNANGKSVIVKYAGSELSGVPGETFSVERMEFEARGLALFNSLPETLANDKELGKVSALGKALIRTLGVHVPRLLYYDRSVPFIILEDIGDHKTYEAWCIATDETKAEGEDIEFVCSRVGKWIARLHGFGHQNFDALKPLFTNVPARTLLDDMFFGLLCTRLIESTQLPDKQELADIARSFSQDRDGVISASRDANPCTLLFGDLWSGAVLFDKPKQVVNLLDLEFADTGLIYLDIAHFVAHLIPVHFLTDPSYNPNTHPWPSHVETFLRMYSQTLKREYPDAFGALVGNSSSLRLMTVFLGIEVARDVLTGNWCRCGKGKRTKDMPIECVCADILLQFASKSMKNTGESIFNILIS
ncbi:hypothetical protein EV175_000954 [Coemansia sp. RSA 1933]|nr:hypothetical protein EV175_000954 [Coemansia sp. RSA 1933]